MSHATIAGLLGWRMPAEWERHSRCWMAWPSRAETWSSGDTDGACVAYAEVARAISAFEPVTVVCNPEDAVDVSLACGGGIQVLPLEIGDSWLRDTGPTFVIDNHGGVGGVHWRFNAWGGLYSDFAKDATVGRRILEHLGLRCFEAPFVLEGGSIAVDGMGTLLATEQCLLNPNRNPNLSRREIEALLKAYTGSKMVVWLGRGYQDDHTDGHVDEVACFVRPGVVLALSTDDPRDGNFAALQDNLDRLRKARDAAGRELQVIPIRQPERRDLNGARLTLSYTNFYIANSGVVMPSFEDPADQDAYRIIRRLFPGRDVVQIPALDIVDGGGGIHCITQQQPAPAPIPYDPVI